MIDNYEFKSTFWVDFSIADAFGVEAILETFNKAFNEYKNDYVMLSELVLVLNWKIWQHHEKGNKKLAELYDSMWEKTEDFAYDTLEGDELDYFFKVVD